MRHRLLVLVLAALSLFFLAWIRPPGPSLIVESTSYAETLIENPQFTVLVVEVLQAGIVKGTNATPPEGEFRVVEVLRGDNVRPGRYPYQVVLHRPATMDAAVWDPRPVHGPVPGDDLIVFTYVGDRPKAEGEPIWLQGPMIRDTPRLRARVLENLKHDSELQFPLFLLILVSPLLGFLPRIGWLSIPVAFVAYRVYEGLMSPYYDIRVDLILIWPALIASVVVPLAAHVWRRKARSHSPGATFRKLLR